jgi:putative ABC transport system substrate-binding protein
MIQRREFNRRDCVTLLGGTAAAWPVAAQAQQRERVRRVGVLMNLAESDPEGQSQLAAFQQRVRALGWIEGGNIRIEYRWTVGGVDRARAFAAELVGLTPDVILVAGGTALSALLHETGSVPIVFVVGLDPVAAGFASSLARPGGNATGFAGFERTMGTKWLEVLKEIAPGVTRAVILNSDNPQSSIVLPPIEAAAASFRVQAPIAHIHDAAEIERAIDASAREANVGLVVLPGTVAIVHRDLIIALAARYRLPAVYPFRYFVAGGGLISYGLDWLDLYRRAAGYVDRILKGEKPADLPVQNPIKYELVLNLKTATALGLTVPATLLARADEVIE